MNKQEITNRIAAVIYKDRGYDVGESVDLKPPPITKSNLYTALH